MASPPSSSTMLACQLVAWMHWSMHHQKSSSDWPRQANIGQPGGEREGGRGKGEGEGGGGNGEGRKYCELILAMQ